MVYDCFELCNTVNFRTFGRTKILERDIERYLVKRVKDVGGIAYKFTSPAHRGVADRCVVLGRGRVWFIEVKTPTGKLTRLQELFWHDMLRRGQSYRVVRSYDDVDAWLAELGL